MRRLILFSSLLMLLSCTQKADNTLANGDFSFSLNAILPEMQLSVGQEDGNEETKASTQYTVRIKWAKGDKISVINLTTGKILGGQLTSNDSGNITSFSGTLNGTVNEGDIIVYFYPAQDNSTEQDFQGIHVDMSSQGGTTGTVPLCLYKTSTASTESFNNTTIVFSYLMGYMMIGLSDIPASARIVSLTLTGLTSSFDVSINSARSGLEILPHAGDIILSPNQQASAAGVKTVYAAIPASATAKRFAVLQTETTSFSTTFTSARLSNGVAYNTNVSGFLVDDLIPEDPKVREYCLEHFDSNGDGRLSMVEIAGVTTFPDQEQYPLPRGITRFNELEYFYSLTSLPSFKDQQQLECITIPSQITEILPETFSGCLSLTKIILKPENPPALGEGALDGVPRTITLLVSDESVSSYQSAEGWSDFFDNFRTGSNENESNIDIGTEDGDPMGEENVDIIINQ